MRKFEIIEHKADLKIKVFGKDKKELFLNAMMGMTDNLQPEIGNLKSKIQNIKIISLDLNTLLVDFLNEVLYLIQINKEIYDHIEFIKFSHTEIEAKLFGYKVKRFGQDIKAATYHNLNIQKRDKTWQATILFDI